jgi:hypothetical protein
MPFQWRWLYDQTSIRENQPDDRKYYPFQISDEISGCSLGESSGGQDLISGDHPGIDR